jgi:hypothetical protein
MATHPVPPNTLFQRYVNIPCPSGKHQRSVLTFRNHSVAAMFCIPCEVAWTEATTHPELREVPVDTAR